MTDTADQSESPASVPAQTSLLPSGERRSEPETWHRSLAHAIRDADELVTRVHLPDEFRATARSAAKLFPLLVPESFLRRIESGKPDDPLLRQILPLDAEHDTSPDFVPDAVDDARFRLAPGLLHKYHGRALLIATGSCAVHCRYCFRRHYPYGEEPRRLADWQPALDALREDASIEEVLLSGGDPLMLTDQRLSDLINRLADIPNLRRLRIHTRLPIVLPDRVTESLLKQLSSCRMKVVVVVHANHPAELADDCAAALRRLTDTPLTVLNQAVLLRGVNDSVEAQCDLSLKLIDLGVMPYYLHQLDRVAGAAHFEVPIDTGRAIVQEMRRRLPGYAVPRYVQENPGESHKTVLE